MYFVDTNIFFEWLLDRKSAKDCEQLLNLAVEGKTAFVCSHFSIHSVCILLVNENKFNETRMFLEFISKTPFINVINITVEDDKKILEIVEKTDLDFDDALQYYLAGELECSAIITFDKDFRKTSLACLTPAQAVDEFKDGAK